MAARGGRRVMVTGLGMATPLGAGVQASWKQLLDGKSGVKAVAALDGLPSSVAATVPRLDEPFAFGIEGRLFNRGDETGLSPFLHFALAAAEEAMRMAEWDPQTDAERERTGVSIGSGIGGLGVTVDAMRAMNERGHRRISPHFIPTMLANMAAGFVSIRGGLRGPSSSPSTACATGVHAIADAMHLIRTGEADVMLAGGSEACIEPLAVAGFSRRPLGVHEGEGAEDLIVLTLGHGSTLGPKDGRACALMLRALSTGFNATPEAASRPFDALRDGFVIGEGSAVLLLEDFEHAVARGAPAPLAELLSVGNASDGHHPTAPSPDGHAALRAMRSALAQADLSVDCIDYINAHATSTPLGDAAELTAIDKLLQSRSAAEPPALLSSTKGATGHLLGAAGAVEAAFTVLALAHAHAPPNLNLTQPDSLDTLFRYVTMDEGLENGSRGNVRPLRAALCNSFGFGGMNASALFVRPDVAMK